jgi:transposase
MEKTVPELMAAISPDDWAQVLSRVLKLIEELVGRMDKLEQSVAALQTENEQLKEQLARTSKNSSQPSSKNPLTFKPNRKEPTGKKRGGQVGHQGHERKLYPVEKCQEIIEHYPQKCSKCGSEQMSNSTNPYRHQVVEIPQIQPIVIEHQFFSMSCNCCGQENQASSMAQIISEGGYGTRVAAYVGLFSSQYRQSYRQIKNIMDAVFGIEMSLGSINRLRSEVSESVSGAVTEAIGYVQKQPTVGVDETGFKQRNGDGQNAAKTSGWLWVVVTPLIICFQVLLSRSAAAAQTVLGESFAGFITSDRCPAYNCEEGVEPTNNAAERAIRPAVIWRRTSFGSDSAAGSEFVSRLLTVISSLKAQERNILDFLAESVSAARSGQIPPSLLP